MPDKTRETMNGSDSRIGNGVVSTGSGARTATVGSGATSSRGWGQWGPGAGLQVIDWMSTPTMGIPPWMSADRALLLMEKIHIAQMRVVEGGRMLGILDQQHLRNILGALPPATGPARITVEDVMTSNPVTVSDRDTLDQVARLMMERGVSSVTVVHGRKVVGVITSKDLARAICQTSSWSPAVEAR